MWFNRYIILIVVFSILAAMVINQQQKVQQQYAAVSEGVLGCPGQPPTMPMGYPSGIVPGEKGPNVMQLLLHLIQLQQQQQQNPNVFAASSSATPHLSGN